MKWLILMALLVDAPPQHVDIVVPSNCLTKDVVLHDCDATVDPPKCKRIEIHYRSSCAVLQIER